MKIQSEQIFNTSVSYFKSLTHRQGELITLGDFLLNKCRRSDIQYLCEEGIRKLDYFKQHELIGEIKRNLPCVLISCLTGQDKSQVLKKNNLLVIDIDLADNSEKLSDLNTLKKLKYALFKLPYVYAVSLSCSGRGIYCIISTGTDNLLGHFYALEEEFRQNGIVIDSACKNINRLRYASFDPDLLIKTETVLYTYDTIKEPQKRVFKANVNVSKASILNLAEPDWMKPSFILALVQLIVDAGYRADTYNRWFNDCWRLVSFGDEGFAAWNYISRHSEGYDAVAVINKWNTEAPKSKIHKADAISYFRYWAVRLLGADWFWMVKAQELKNEENKNGN